MLQQELLLTLSEISVTIAALSAVAGAVKHETFSKVSSGLLRDVAVIGMLVALFAILPLIFWSDESDTAFRLCAAAAACTWLAGYVLYLQGVYRDRSQITGTFWSGMAITTLGMVLLVLCTLPLEWAVEKTNITLYLLAMLTWLAIAGLNFVASVFSTKD